MVPKHLKCLFLFNNEAMMILEQRVSSGASDKHIYKRISRRRWSSSKVSLLYAFVHGSSGNQLERKPCHNVSI